MKKILLASIFSFGLLGANATVVIIANSGTSYPANTPANVGDTIRFVVGVGHTATEVDLATWNANGNTPLGTPGSFNFGSGTHDVKMTTAGIRYFVCSPHASMGMKGKITVTGGTNIVEQNTAFLMSLYPNPATDLINLNVSGAENEVVSLSVVNLLGSKVIDLGGKQTLNNGVKSIDISALPKGVYFLNITGDDKNRSFRFVKQ